MEKNIAPPSAIDTSSRQTPAAVPNDMPKNIIFELDTAGRLVDINQTARAFTDYRLADIQGQDWCRIFVPDRDRKRVRKIIKQTLKHRQYPSGHHIDHLIDKAGSERLVEWRGKLLTDPQGNPTGLLIIGQDITAIKQAGEQSIEMLKQNRNMARHIFETQEIERRYLARLLHDEFGQWLTAIQLNIQSITNRIGTHSPEVDASIESITHSANQIYQGIRHMVQNLRPVLLDQLGLTDSLQELVDRWQEQHPAMSCQLRMTGELDNLAENHDITLYRLVQEGLAFAAKHAQACHIVVQLTRRYTAETGEDCLILSLSDYGIDIPPESLDFEFGLLNMRERTLSAGGIFHIDHQREKEMLITAQLFNNRDSNKLQ